MNKRLGPRTYSHVLRVLALAFVLAISLMIVMSDQGEDFEPWEFVTVKAANT